MDLESSPLTHSAQSLGSDADFAMQVGLGRPDKLLKASHVVHGIPTLTPLLRVVVSSLDLLPLGSGRVDPLNDPCEYIHMVVSLNRGTSI